MITFKNVNTHKTKKKMFALVPSLIGQPPLLRLLPVLWDQNLARLHQPRRRRLFFFFVVVVAAVVVVVVVVHQVLERLLRAELRAFDFRLFPGFGVVHLCSRFALDFHRVVVVVVVVVVVDELGVWDGHASASRWRRLHFFFFFFFFSSSFAHLSSRENEREKARAPFE